MQRLLLPNQDINVCGPVIGAGAFEYSECDQAERGLNGLSDGDNSFVVQPGTSYLPARAEELAPSIGDLL